MSALGSRALGALGVLVALALTACAGAPPPIPPDPAPMEGPLLLLFERRGCHGFCPIYWLRITCNGDVLYSGEHFVAVPGRQRRRLRDGELQALREAFAAADFFALDERYTRPRYRELPRIITTYREGGRTHRVVHHLGDVSAPAALLELEEAIDRIVGSAAWVGEGELSGP